MKTFLNYFAQFVLGVAASLVVLAYGEPLLQLLQIPLIGAA